MVLLWTVFLSQARINNWEALICPPCLTQHPPLERERKGSFSVLVVLFYYWCFFFWPGHAFYGMLVPWPGIEPGPPALEAQNPNHWITREFPVVVMLFAWKKNDGEPLDVINLISYLCKAYETQEEGSRQEPSLPSVSMCSTGWVSSKWACFWASDRFSCLR